MKVGYIAFAPLPESFYKDPKAFGENPVGNGMYKFTHWDHNSQIELAKNADYKGVQKVANDGVTFKIYTSADSAYSDVQGGNLDVTGTIPASAIKTFEKDSSVEAYNKAGSVIQAFTIPSDYEHWKVDTEEGHLRRLALSMAIDREEIVEKVLGGTGTVATDFSSPAIPGYADNLKNSENLKYNPTKAKELWKKADAISKYDGKLVFSYDADKGFKPVFEAIVNSANNVLGEVGLKATANPVPTFQEFRNSIDERSMKGAFRTGWTPDYPSIEDYLYQIYDSAAADGKGANDGDYRNADVDALFTKAMGITNQDERNKVYQDAEVILLDELPSIPLYYSNAVGVAAAGVKGFTMDWQNQPIFNELSKS